MVALHRGTGLHGVAQAAARRGHRRGHDAERGWEHLEIPWDLEGVVLQGVTHTYV